MEDMLITAVDDKDLWIGQKVKDWNGRILTIIPTEQLMKGDYDPNTQVTLHGTRGWFIIL